MDTPDAIARLKEEIRDEIRRDLLPRARPVDPARIGLLRQPPEAAPVPVLVDAATVVADAGAHDDHDAHSHMPVFPMFQRDESGQIVAVDPETVGRDTSTYDEDGEDRGIVSRQAPPDSGGHEHEHGSGGHGHGHAHGPDPAPRSGRSRRSARGGGTR